MKSPLACLVLFAMLFTLAISAPLERGHGVLHRLSPHRGLSRRMQATRLAKRPLNLTFTPTNAGDVPVHVEYDVSTQPQPRTADFRFSAKLLKLDRDGDIIDAEHPSGRDAQVAVRLADTYGGRHVVISAPDPVVQTLQQKGVSQDDMPQYVRQNVHVADPNTGDQYQLVPDSNPDSEEPPSISIDSSTIVITLNVNQ